MTLYSPQSLDFVRQLSPTSRGGQSVRYNAIVEELPPLAVDLAYYGNMTPACLVVAFSGGYGEDWWAEPIPRTYTAASLPGDVAFVDVRWPAKAWFQAPDGEPAGPHRMAAYVASVMRFLVARYPGAKLSLLGASSGATAALNYAAFYDPERLVSNLVTTSGPLVKIRRMCRLNGIGAVFVDLAFGFAHHGPCADFDMTWIPEWDAADASKSGSIDHEKTKITAIFGTRDWISPGADERVERWLEDKPNSQVVKVPAGHIVHQTDAGMREILKALGGPS